MKQYMLKFRKIHAALEERREEPEYIQIFYEIESFLEVNFELISFTGIKELYEKMIETDSKLPDIDDVENMIGMIKFQ